MMAMMHRDAQRCHCSCRNLLTTTVPKNMEVLQRTKVCSNVRTKHTLNLYLFSLGWINVFSVFVLQHGKERGICCGNWQLPQTAAAAFTSQWQFLLRPEVPLRAAAATIRGQWPIGWMFLTQRCVKRSQMVQVHCWTLPSFHILYTLDTDCFVK